MKKLMCLVVVSALLAAGSVFAGDVSKCCGKSKGKCTAGSAGCSKAASLTADAAGVCPKTLAAMVDKVMGDMPRMIYVAGDSKTVCFKTAVKKVGCESKVGYQVAGKRYECKQSASEALASLLEDHALEIMSVQHMLDGQRVRCANKAATLAADESSDLIYRLAGVDFKCSEKAKVAAEAVRQAVIDLAASNPRAAAFVKANYVEDGPSKKRSASGCSKGTTAKIWGQGGCSKSGSGDSAGQVKVASGSAGCSKSASGCSKSAATVASASPKSGCGSKANVAVASASAKSGCCSKAKAAVASTGAKVKPALASGIIAGGCIKSKAAVASADAKGGCCSKVKAAVASAVAATKGCCSKTAKTVAGGKAGCGSKCSSACSDECAGKCTAACTTACAKANCSPANCPCGSKGTSAKSASGCCSKGQSVSADKIETPEERLANIQNLLRVMIETAARNSLS